MVFFTQDVLQFVYLTVRFAEALQSLPKRVRRELLEGPSQEIQQTFAAKLEKGLPMKLATPLVR